MRNIRAKFGMKNSPFSVVLYYEKKSSAKSVLSFSSQFFQILASCCVNSLHITFHLNSTELEHKMNSRRNRVTHCYFNPPTKILQGIPGYTAFEDHINLQNASQILSHQAYKMPKDFLISSGTIHPFFKKISQTFSNLSFSEAKCIFVLDATMRDDRTMTEFVKV